MLKKIFCIIVLCNSFISAENGVDSTDTPIVLDTTFSDSILFDTTGIDVDTLSDAQRAYQIFLSRQNKRKEFQTKKVREVKTYLSFYDSLVVSLLHPRLNEATEVTRSFTKDAGDYFRMNPSYFVRDYQQTPLRKTVKPFGLSGNRLNIISNRLVMSPFEHILEPDGQIDMNDIPTGLAKDIYLLPGSIGQLFGGAQSVASLITVPNRHDTGDYEPEIHLQINKGSINYAYTRAGYTKRFTTGKELELSVDYRNTSGLRFNTDDNSYHYTGRTVIPLNETYIVNASGSTYRRKGSYKVLSGASGRYITRNRKDRIGKIAIENMNDDQTVKNHFGYTYQKQDSNLDNAYIGRYNFISNGFNLTRESNHGNRLMKSEISFSHLKQTDGITEHTKKVGKGSIAMLKKNEQSSFATTIGTKYDDGYKFLPFASAVYQKYSDKQFFMLSLGYSETAPSMHDLNIDLQADTIYSNDLDYAENGNDSLSSEKQLTGSLMYEYGSLKNNLRITLTGGIIQDGNDWYNIDTTLNLISLKLFTPKNSDISFANILLKQKVSLSEVINISFGGAYHYIDYDITESKAYQPDYQLFFGGQLHKYWKQKLIDLYLYGEAMYDGLYKGYFNEDLGNNITINTGLAFKIKRFRFHYIFQNSIQAYSPNIDGFNSTGQFSYYGFSWFFLN